MAAGEYVLQSRPRRMRNGQVTWEVESVHPDPRVQVVLEQIREAEIIQAVDRVRPVFNERKIIMASSIVCDITVDRVATWRDVLAGGTRLERVLAATGFLPLSGKWLARISPGVFESINAADLALKREEVNGVKTPISITIGELTPLTMAEFRASHQRGPKASQVLIDTAVHKTSAEARSAFEAAIGESVASWVMHEDATTPSQAQFTKPATIAPSLAGCSSPGALMWLLCASPANRTKWDAATSNPPPNRNR